MEKPWSRLLFGLDSKISAPGMPNSTAGMQLIQGTKLAAKNCRGLQISLERRILLKDSFDTFWRFKTSIKGLWQYGECLRTSLRLLGIVDVVGFSRKYTGSPERKTVFADVKAASDIQIWCESSEY
jgi:hypothetical protein